MPLFITLLVAQGEETEVHLGRLQRLKVLIRDVESLMKLDVTIRGKNFDRNRRVLAPLLGIQDSTGQGNIATL